MDNLVGNSKSMTEMARLIRKAASANWTVLIQGESGTGKGVVARSIHQHGTRAKQPFVVVNCGAMPDQLVESELFGYERGAFTGADRQKAGLFEAAQGGTIFLDEIGELSLASQSRLLHVLQEKEIERLGGKGRRIPIDVQVIAATNRELDQMVAEGRFREDLFFRLDVLSIRTPPLRERPGDIPALARHFALKYGAQSGRGAVGISQPVLDIFIKYPWPGNVRQLENMVQRAVALGETAEVLIDDIPQKLVVNRSQPSARNRTFYEAMDETVRELFTEAFDACNGNCADVARRMGLHRSTVYRLLQKHGLNHLLDNDIRL